MKTRFTALLAAAACALSAPAWAAATPAPAASGFYGGIALRQTGADGTGVSLGHLANAWARFGQPTADDTGSRTLMFGGYRWGNDFALEASVETAERYSLQRTDPLGRRGVGLALPGVSLSGTTTPTLAPEGAARSWNLDLYGSWAFWRSFSLYGRLGYVQPEPASVVYDVRRHREGVNYGVGLRYDMTRSLGLKLEYARFGHLFGESIGTTLPDSDQVQFGLQYRF